MKKLGVLVLASAVVVGAVGSFGAMHRGGVVFAAEDTESGTEVTLESFAQAENLFVDTDGVLDSYSFDNADQRPWPSDWGIKFGKSSEGKYAGINNSRTAYGLSGAHAGSYMPVKKDVSNVSTYCVSATIELSKRYDWGGIGIVFGRGANEAPAGVWYGVDSKTVYLAANTNEFLNVFGAENDVVKAEGDTMNLAVVVDGRNVSVYVDEVKIGDTYTLGENIEFTPAIGGERKNFNGNYTNFSFKTLDEVPAANAEYTITYISGAVKIGDSKYTYGAGAALQPVERPGYKFMGWHYLTDLSDAVVESIPATHGGDLTLYCEYNKTAYTISYYDGETKLENEDWDTTYEYGSYISLPATVEKEGYTFEGWYASSDFSGDAVDSIQTTEYGNKTYYAKFKSNATKPEENGSKGCSGSVVGGVSAGIGMIAIALGATVVTLKRKHGDR